MKLSFFSSFYEYYTPINGYISSKQSPHTHFHTQKTPQYITHTNRSDHLTQSDTSIFILSHNSEKSKRLFSAIYTTQKSGKRKTHTLLVEHITGSITKNTQKALQKEPMIMIGGYHYLLNIIGKKKHIDALYILSIPQNMEKYIITDVTIGLYSV